MQKYPQIIESHACILNMFDIIFLLPIIFQSLLKYAQHQTH